MLILKRDTNEITENINFVKNTFTVVILLNLIVCLSCQSIYRKLFGHKMEGYWKFYGTQIDKGIS